MQVSRRTAMKAMGAAGGLTAASGVAMAIGEHPDDKRPKPDEKSMNDEKPAESPGAAVRVAHFSPDAPNVDVYVDGNQVLSNVAYGDVSPYLEIEPGTYTVKITAAGDPGTVAFEGDVTLQPAFYTIAAIGELGASSFEPLVLLDAGSALARVIHTVPDAPTVDIYVEDELLFEGLSFGESTDYAALPAGTFTVSIRPAGDPETTLLSFEAAREIGVAYSAYAIGYANPPAGTEGREFTVKRVEDGPMDEKMKK
ncbi:DUF4397 domain-containing protein [Natrinema gelatinilyticum]|uniref:DUF4397 domain-containing protein n=1 Tax=Natrinema gelatinilyticum TaxID=2961571 RepID=UPI0020C37E03|nr:DUF4397 domain-containing protein [Natrinema gelatinilyticum]